MDELLPKNEVFIVRLWTASSGGQRYHGLIQHVRTGQSRAIHELAELVSVFGPYFSDENKPAAAETSPRRGIR